MKTLTILFLTLFTVSLTGCDETKKVIDVAGTVQLSGTYTVTNLSGSPAKETNMNFTFAALDKSIRGNTGCNTFFGNYTIDLYTINVGDLAVTERYCDEPVMEGQRAFLKALKETGSYALQEGVLTLYSKNDRSVLLSAKKEAN